MSARVAVSQGSTQSAAEMRRQIDAQVRARVDETQARADAQQVRLEAEQAAREARLAAQDAAREAQLAAQGAAREAQLEAAAAVREARGQNEPIIVVPSHRGGPPSDIPREAVVISIAFFMMIAIIVIGLPIVRAFTRRMERSAANPAIGPEVAAQIQRIEHTVESMAIELERISEAQRFSAKLDAERGGQPALAARSPRDG